VQAKGTTLNTMSTPLGGASHKQHSRCDDHSDPVGQPTKYELVI